MSDSTPGWQADPTGKHDHRYWDGTQWTDNVADAGVAGTDPYEALTDAAPEPDVPPAEPEAPAAEADAPAAEEPTVVTPVAAVEDTTASYPTATTPPAAPPPYVPPTPAAGGDGSEGGSEGGSKRGLVVGGAILAAVAVAVVAFLLLGGDDDDSDVRAQLATAIEDNTDVDGEQAECVADLLVDEAGEDAFEDTDFDADDPPPEFVAALLEVGAPQVAEQCGIDEEAFGGSDGTTDGTTDSTDDDGADESLEDLEAACADGDLTACDDLYFSADFGSELEEFGSTCGGTAEPQSGSCETTDGGEDDGEDSGGTGGLSDGDLEEIMANAYMESLGLSREQADCLAGKMADAIEDGSLTEEQAFTEVFDYLSDCDISLDEISN